MAKREPTSPSVSSPNKRVKAEESEDVKPKVEEDVKPSVKSEQEDETKPDIKPKPASPTTAFAILQNHYHQSNDERTLASASVLGVYPSLSLANHQAWITFRTTVCDANCDVWDASEEGAGTETHPPEEADFVLVEADPCSWRTCNGEGEQERVRDRCGALTGGAKGGWGFIANDEENQMGFEVVVVETKVYGC